MKQVAGVLLVAADGDLLMQLRDDKPGIANPGKVTAFGGAAERDESPLEAAHRELQEETNLRPDQSELVLLNNYRKQENDEDVTIFILRGVDPENLKVYEGQGYVRVNQENRAAIPLSALANEVVTDYFALSLT